MFDMGAMLLNAKAFYQAHTPESVRYFVWVAESVYLSPVFYLIVASVFLLERIMPAKRDQTLFSAGVFQDFVWFNLYEGFNIFFLPIYAGYLHAFYQTFLSVLTIDAVGVWPAVWGIVFSIVAFDFLQWFHHFLRHKVEPFWYFHTIHHSQRRMNLFTDGRVHLLEPIVANTILFIPMFVLGLKPAAILWIALASKWYQRIYHANLRTNYGPLRFVLVTPQSHRIHHSIEPKHSDKNFGVLFTVWDRMFGTWYPSYDEYPETGVSDGSFPLERGTKIHELMAATLAQFFYPFKKIWSFR